MDNNTPGNGKKDKLINLCGLWKTTAKNGNVYLRGRIGGATVLILANKFKTAENQPDFTLCLGSAQTRDESANEGDFVEILGVLSGIRNQPRVEDQPRKRSDSALFNERASSSVRSSLRRGLPIEEVLLVEANDPVEKRRATPEPRRPPEPKRRTQTSEFDGLDATDEDVRRFMAAADQDDFGSVPPPRRRGR